MYVIAAESAQISAPEGIWLCMVYPYDWSSMMTPWSCGEKQEGMDVTGKGGEYAACFHDEVINYVEQSIDADVTCRGIGGYSLGGIMALYMSYVTGDYDYAASVSGSMWYPGMAEYLTGNEPSTRTRSYYLSLGTKEAMTKNVLRQTVLERTSEVYEYLRGIRDATMEMNPGGHFTDINGRIEKSIRYFT